MRILVGLIVIVLAMFATSQADATARRYWRLDFIYGGEDQGGNMGLSEIEMRVTLGGSTVTTGGSAIGTTADICVGSLASAFNGNTSDEVVWCGNAYSKTIGYDFGSGNDKDIIQISVRPRPSFPAQSPWFGLIRSSPDNSTWTTIWTFNATAWSGGVPQVFTLPTDWTLIGGHRCWQVEVSSNDGDGTFPNRVGANQMFLYTDAAAATSDVIGIATVTSAPVIQNTATRLMLRQTFTDYVMGSSALPQAFAIFDFGASAPPIRVIKVMGRTQGGTLLQNMQAGTIYYSDDCSSWTATQTFAGLTGWTNGQVRTLPTIPAPVTMGNRIIFGANDNEPVWWRNPIGACEIAA